jgi:hypothetical protein
MKRYTLDELDRETAVHPEMDGDHANYVGRGKYVLEDSPAAYMNHSCDPNCEFKMHSIAVYDVYAIKDIAVGEELSHDYTANSVDQFDGKGFWVLDCKCGSSRCRKTVTGDYFAMPVDWHLRNYPNLPPSNKRKHREHFTKRRKTHPSN